MCFCWFCLKSRSMLNFSRCWNKMFKVKKETEILEIDLLQGSNCLLKGSTFPSKRHVSPLKVQRKKRTILLILSLATGSTSLFAHALFVLPVSEHLGRFFFLSLFFYFFYLILCFLDFLFYFINYIILTNITYTFIYIRTMLSNWMTK